MMDNSDLATYTSVAADDGAATQSGTVRPTSVSRRLMLMRRRMTRAIRPTFLATMVVWSLFPIIWTVANSFKNRVDIFAMPPRFLFTPNLDAWREVLRRTGTYSVYDTMLNTLAVSVGTVLLVLLTAGLASYAIVVYRFKGRMAVLMGMLGTRLIPPIAALVPLYMTMFSLGILDTWWVLILIYTTLGIPFAIWLLKTFMEAIPRDITEASVVDGCGPFQSFWHVTVPLTRPGIAATAAFTFLLAWNEFMFAFMFTSVRARTLTVQLGNVRGEDTILWQIMSAQSTVLLIPAVVLGLFMQRHLVTGLTAGASK